MRLKEDGLPAAGTFQTWPKSLAQFKLLDPSCGSGHFLVAALRMLVPLRMQDEGLSEIDAISAVFRDNLFGLEIDPRCAQIAAFNLALTAWRMVGYCELPSMNIACVGIGPNASVEEWHELAEQSGRPLNAVSRGPVLDGLRYLHELFSDAATLGSLIDPNKQQADLFTADFETLKPYLATAFQSEKQDALFHERAVAAQGIVKAAELLAGQYTIHWLTRMVLSVYQVFVVNRPLPNACSKCCMPLTARSGLIR